MPNPLAKLGKSNQSKQTTAPQRSAGVSNDSIAPHEESVLDIAYVNPYRGMEDHGVDGTKATPVPDIDTEPEEEYDANQWPEDPDPIPVRIVNNAAREDKAFKTIVGYATNSPQSAVLGRDAERTRVTINYTGTDVVYLSHQSTLAVPQFGYPLSPDTHFSLLTDQPIYLGTAGPVVRVNIMVEYS